MELPIIYPMNAKADDKRLVDWWESEEVIAEEKFDGSRYLMYLTPQGSRFFSRRKSDITGKPVEKTENLPHLNHYSADKLVILDGEIIAGEGQTSNEVTSIMGSLPERAVGLQEQRGYVNYIVFDILYTNDKNIMSKPWYERRHFLQSFAKEIPSKHMRPSDFRLADKQDYYEEIVEQGGEGVVLKNINGLYIPDKRPVGNWIKVKKYSTYDVIITGFEPPEKVYTGKYLDNWSFWEGDTPVTRYYYNGWIGAVKFGAFVDGEFKEIGRTSGMADSIREMLSKNPEAHVGRVIEVGAMGVIPKTHALRHPRFLRIRSDKSPKDCIISSK